MRRPLAVIAVAVVLVGCSASSLDRSDQGASCRAAGGQCYVGSAAAMCIQQGPDGCDSDPPSPGGLFCCLAFRDAGDGE